MNDAYEAGYDAYACGLPITYNPWPDSFCDEYQEWEEGWLAASYK